MSAEGLLEQIEASLTALTAVMEDLQRPRVRKIIDSSAVAAARRAQKKASALRERLRAHIAMQQTVKRRLLKQQSGARSVAKDDADARSLRELREHLLQASLRRMLGQLHQSCTEAERDVAAELAQFLDTERHDSQRLIARAEADVCAARTLRLAHSRLGAGGGEDADPQPRGDVRATDNRAIQAEIEQLRDRRAALARELETAQAFAQRMLDDVDTLQAARAAVAAEHDTVMSRLVEMTHDAEATLHRQFDAQLAEARRGTAELRAKVAAHELRLRDLAARRRRRFESDPLHRRLASLRDEQLRPLIDSELQSLRQREEAAAAARRAAALLDSGVEIATGSIPLGALTHTGLASALSKSGAPTAAGSRSIRVLLVRDDVTGEGRAIPLSGSEVVELRAVSSAEPGQATFALVPRRPDGDAPVALIISCDVPPLV